MRRRFGSKVLGMELVNSYTVSSAPQVLARIGEQTHNEAMSHSSSALSIMTSSYGDASQSFEEQSLFYVSGPSEAEIKYISLPV